jgi:catechol 2,3-dioxygenase-like lactoylglutathione lyase family enzyme
VTTCPGPSLVPELLVTDVSRSIDFWCGLCGFTIDYQREDEGFAYLSRGTAHVMLEQVGRGRNWVTAPLEPPLGRGINFFQITIPDLTSTLAAIRRPNRELFMEPETKWYRIDNEESGVMQFLVTDPDGYLIRFQAQLGRRPLAR